MKTLNKMLFLFLLPAPVFAGPVFDTLKIEGALTCSAQTANTVPYFNGSKVLTSSSVTNTELGFLSGLTSSAQTQINAKVSKSGDTMTGQLVLPSLKVKDGSNELLQSYDTGFFKSTTANSIGLYSTGGTVEIQANGAGVHFDDVSNGNSFDLNSDGSAELRTTNAGSFNLYADASFNTEFGFNGGDFVAYNKSLEADHLRLNGTGGTRIYSLGGEDIEIISTNHISLSSGSGSGRVYTVMDIVPGSDKTIKLGASDLNFSELNAAAILFSGKMAIEAQSRTANDLDGNEAIDFSAKSNVQFPEDVTVGQSIYADVMRPNNIQLEGTSGNGLVEFPSQSPAPSAPGGSGFRLYANNLTYPTFKDDSNRSFSISTNAITLGSSVELTVPNSSGTIATQPWAQSQFVTPTNVTWSSFRSSLSTLNLSNTYFYVFTGTTATWSLPTIGSGNHNREIRVKNAGSGNLTINVVGGGSTIYKTSAVSSFVIPAGASCDFQSDTVNWQVINYSLN